MSVPVGNIKPTYLKPLAILTDQITPPSLLISLKRGDEEAFKILVDEYKNKVFNTCLGLLNNEEDADDIAQEVFLEVFKSIVAFKEDADLGTWIYRIAVNKSLELLRSKSRKKRFAWLTSLFGKEEVYGGKHADFIHPGVQLENKERSAILFQKINMLPENQKTAFVLHKVEGLSYGEVCDVMELSIASVESLIHRAKKNLKKTLEGYYAIDKDND